MNIQGTGEIIDSSGNITTNVGTVDGVDVAAEQTRLASTSGSNTGDQDLSTYVTKTGTPVDNQIAVWTDDGVAEGDANFTYDGVTLDIVHNGAATQAMQITSNESGSRTNGLLYIDVQNVSYDGPVLRIVSASTDSEGQIRIDAPTPEIEMVETDQTTPAGKFEMRVQADRWTVNGRNAADTAFNEVLIVERQESSYDDLVRINAATTSSTDNSLTFDNATSSAGARLGLCWMNSGGALDNARISAMSGSSHANSTLYFQVADSSKVLQERMNIDVSGNLNVTTGDVNVASGSKFNFEGSGGDSYMYYNSSSSKVELWVDGAKKAEWG